ncbi:type I secretion system permease/ATPase [Sphingomonas rosea]
MKQALSRVRPHLVAAAVFSAGVNLLYIVPTIYMLQVYDRVVPTRGVQTLFLLTMVLLFALGTLSLLDRIRSKLLARAAAQLDLSLAARVMDASIARPDLSQAGTALRDLESAKGMLAGPAMLALFDAPWVPIYILVCFLLHPYIGLLAIVGGAALPAIAWMNERTVRPHSVRAEEQARASYSLQDSLLGGAESIRALGMRRALVLRQLRAREAMLTEQSSVNFAGGAFFTGGKFVRLALQSLALGLGALLAVEGLISPGAIFASSFLIARALQPIEQLIGAIRPLGAARRAMTRLDDLLGSEQDAPRLTELPPLKGALTAEAISVRHPDRDGAVLMNVSFAVEPGQAIAIIGPSGAGKSTLLRVLAGALPADRGDVRFDGSSRADWDPERLALEIGYVPQDSRLFPGTVAENIARFAGDRLVDPGEIDAMVIAAAEAVGALDLIQRLPGGFNHRLGPGGRGLSAGQAQRVALARAFFGDPRILLLDEPNSNLDGEGDAALTKAIAEAKERGRTVLIVSHKLGVLPVIDKILLMRDGQAEMFGPRDEVLQRIMPPRPAPVAVEAKA